MQCNLIQQLIIDHLLFAKNYIHIWDYKYFSDLVHSSMSGKHRHYFKGNAVGMNLVSKQMDSKV